MSDIKVSRLVQELAVQQNSQPSDSAIYRTIRDSENPSTVSAPQSSTSSSVSHEESYIKYNSDAVIDGAIQRLWIYAVAYNAQTRDSSDKRWTA